MDKQERLTKLKEALDAGRPGRVVSLSPEQDAFCKTNYHFLTRKPIIYVANVSEADLMDIDNCVNCIINK